MRGGVSWGYKEIIHQHLSRDHHPKIAFVAAGTVSVIEHTLPDLLSDSEGREDQARSAEAAAVEVLAETINGNDPASPRYQAGLRNDIRNDGGSITVTEFTSSILAATDRSWHDRSRQDLRGSRIDL